LLSLTDRVERLVGEGNWIEASAVEAERQRLLEQYVEQSSGDKQGLRLLLERNLRTLETAEGQRAELSNKSSLLTQRRRALEAYVAHASHAEDGRS
jgi:hypothetical protein